MTISEVFNDLQMCRKLLDKLEKAVQNGKLTPMTAHAVVVKVNEYLDILEAEFENN